MEMKISIPDMIKNIDHILYDEPYTIVIDDVTHVVDVTSKKITVKEYMELVSEMTEMYLVGFHTHATFTDKYSIATQREYDIVVAEDSMDAVKIYNAAYVTNHGVCIGRLVNDKIRDINNYILSKELTYIISYDNRTKKVIKEKIPRLLGNYEISADYMDKNVHIFRTTDDALTYAVVCESKNDLRKICHEAFPDIPSSKTKYIGEMHYY